MEKNSYFDVDTSAYEGTLTMFCCEENLPDRLKYLDQELCTLGYPTILEDASSYYEISHVKAANTLYDLMQTNRRNVEKCQSLTEIQQSNQSEIYRLQHVINRVKNDVKLKGQDILDKKLLCEQYRKRIETLEKKLKLSQDKNKKYLADLVSRDVHFRHERKKKTTEIERLQERLNQFLQDKKNERMRGIEIMNSLQRADGKRGKWVTEKTKKNKEQEMYRVVLTNYEEFQSKLLKENEDMRGYLKIMQNELIAALNENSTFDNNGRRKSCISLSSSCSSTSELSEGVFEMPYDIVKEDIEKHLHKKWRALRKVISSRSSVSEDCVDARYAGNVDNGINYKGLVKEQQDLIEYLTSCKASERSIPDDCLMLEEKSEFEKEKRKFHQKCKMFEKEKSMLRDDLAQLDVERQKFELEKRDWLQQNFLTMTPFRKSPIPKQYFTYDDDQTPSAKSMMYDESFSSIKSSRTPVNKSYVRNYSIAEPSTAELYRKLGLEYNNPLKSNKDHKQNIEDFHHKVRSTAKKPSNDKSSQNMQNQTTAAGNEYLEVNTSPTKSRNHSRSRSAPKDVNYFQTTRGTKQKRILYDFTDQKRRTNKMSLHVEDLKMALFQDQNSP